MIHVAAQPEPETFDSEVRQKGLAWLRRKEIPLDRPLRKSAELKPYWRHCLDEMYLSYNGCCAYLAVFFERVTGEGSVDHFVAKSERTDLAYEWSNYRLACSRMNSRKRDYDDVLDPFEVETGWFRLELVSGRIFPDPGLPEELQARISATIKRLGLDDPGSRELRTRHFQNYIEKDYPEDYLRRYSPFVWSEVERQGLL
ncbi:MAG: hypothetical protein HQL31_07550 [Planctomycetes bacterium]|nr:hypothetical protein [Planctomycetota bacterium]